MLTWRVFTPLRGSDLLLLLGSFVIDSNHVGIVAQLPVVVALSSICAPIVARAVCQALKAAAEVCSGNPDFGLGGIVKIVVDLSAVAIRSPAEASIPTR